MLWPSGSTKKKNRKKEKKWKILCVKYVHRWEVNQKEILVPYLLYISESLSVKQNQGVVCLYRMRHTPHPNSLGVRLYRGSNREAYKGWGRGAVERM